MKNRSLAAVILLPFVTFGIYTLYWFVSTKGELNAKGANIPTSWLLIVPFVNIYWMYKYYEGAEQVTAGKTNALLLFLLGLFVTNIISSTIAQSAYNDLTSVQQPQTAPMPAGQPQAPTQNPTV